MDPLLYPTTAAATHKNLDDCYYDRDLLTGVLLSRRSSHFVSDLRNCDLPPPLNTALPINEAPPAVQDDKNQPAPPAKSKDDLWDEQSATANYADRNDDTKLLRALRLSQTRAREAERKAALVTTRNEQMVALFLQESLKLSAHQHWVKLLETEIPSLHKNRELQNHEDEESLPVTAAAAWCFAMALYLAGVGYALGRCRF